MRAFAMPLLGPWVLALAMGIALPEVPCRFAVTSGPVEAPLLSCRMHWARSPGKETLAVATSERTPKAGWSHLALVLLCHTCAPA